jgi:uncharacterized protein (TIGR03437 family)
MPPILRLPSLPVLSPYSLDSTSLPVPISPWQSKQNGQTYTPPFTETAPDQLTLQLPLELELGPATIRISEAPVFPIQLAPASPRFFTSNNKGTGQISLSRKDGTAVDGLAPARPDELLTAYLTGASAASPVSSILSIGAVSFPVEPPTPSTDLPGIYLLTFTVPATVPEGSTPIRLQIGNEISPITATCTFTSIP